MNRLGCHRSLLRSLLVQSISCRNGRRKFEYGNAANLEVFCFSECRLRWRLQKALGFRVKAVGDSIDSTAGGQVEDGVRIDFVTKESDSYRWMAALQGTICDLPSFICLVKRNAGSKYAMGFYIALTVVLILVRQILPRRKIPSQHGSVAELVKRGQLRSDRRCISKALKYEDPFNNPQVKIEKDNSKLEMCGKVYRLAPVTLSQQQQLIHQRRRSRAYQWKRPTIFLKEGDAVPQDVDPDTISWIPPNHPFATTATELDESLAQNNVFQKHGVPFRVRAEHEALQKKLQALQIAQNEIGIKQNNEQIEQIHSPEQENDEFSSSGNDSVAK